MARMNKEKTSEERITKEKENEIICGIIQRDFFGITDNVPEDTYTLTPERGRKKILKRTPFWTAVTVFLLSFIGTTVATVLLGLDEGQYAGYGIGTALAMSATVLASIILWHVWNDRRKRRLTPMMPPSIVAIPFTTTKASARGGDKVNKDTEKGREKFDILDAYGKLNCRRNGNKHGEKMSLRKLI